MTDMSQYSIPMQLPEGSQIRLGGRVGKIFHNKTEVCEVLWEERVEPETGEVIPALAEHIKLFELGRTLSSGELEILSRPPVEMTPGEARSKLAERVRSHEEIKRAAWRNSYLQAAERVLAEDEGARPTRAWFDRNLQRIVEHGYSLDRERVVNATGKRRAGSLHPVPAPPASGKSVWIWWNKHEKYGPAGLFDNVSACGNRDDRFTEEEEDLLREIVNFKLTEERVFISTIDESVKARFREENRRRSQSNPRRPSLKVPGYDKVWNAIAMMAPLDHKIRTRGMDVAYRDLHTLGRGLEVTRPLERVEMDEYTVDLMVLLRMLGIEQFLSDEERIKFGLDGTPQRVVLSAAIDVCTGAILAFQIARDSSVDLALSTIEMIYLDKQPLADAVGALSPWPMRGQPEMIVMDRGSNYIAEETFLRLAAAGITYFGSPAGKPFLKPWIERFNGTLGSKFLPKFTGRTFSNVVDRGENDPAARATLTLDEFLFWLTRWIVDVYHNATPRTLNRAAPLTEWHRAVRETPPIIQTDQTRLRRVFGVSLKRKVSRQGLRVMNIHYMSDKLASHFLNSSARELEVRWWQHDVGYLEAELPDGEWITLESTDPYWKGKTHDDIRAVVEAAARREESQIEASDRAILEMDELTRSKAELRGLLPRVPTPEDLTRQEKAYKRYMNTAERDRAFGAHGDIFDKEVLPDERDDEDAREDREEAEEPDWSDDDFDDGDIME